MKKLLIILPAFLFTLAANAQTEDEVYIGLYPKGATCLNFKVNYVQQKNEVI